MPGPTLRVLDSLDAVARTAAQWVHDWAWAAANARGRFTLALSGGNTPRVLYRRMADGPRLPWDRTVFCFGDERNVPPDNPESNARMARETLTGQPFVTQSSVYRIKGELPAEEAAADYEQTLRTLFPGTTTFPGFDLVLLGLGPDGHTASLFPALAGAGRAHPLGGSELGGEVPDPPHHTDLPGAERGRRGALPGGGGGQGVGAEGGPEGHRAGAGDSRPGRAAHLGPGHVPGGFGRQHPG